MTFTIPDDNIPSFVALIKQASEQLSNNGCNDFPLPNTDENWALWERMHAWNENKSVDEWRRTSSDIKDWPRPARSRKINFMDWFLLAYLAAVIEGKA